jgi:hypothetical protein
LDGFYIYGRARASKRDSSDCWSRRLGGSRFAEGALSNSERRGGDARPAMPMRPVSNPMKLVDIHNGDSVPDGTGRLVTFKANALSHG